MGVFGMINTSASGLTAERFRMDIISDNIANANTTVTDKGGPYKRKLVVFQERKEEFQIPMNVEINKNKQQIVGNGVRVIGVTEDNTPFKMVYDPNHPNANKDGYVSMPNVNVIKEMTDMITATRAYEANVTVLNGAKGMASAALSIGK